MSATFFAITSPAPWATTLDRLAAAELPRTDWSSLEPLGETGRYRFAPPPTPGRSSPQRQRTHCPKGHPYDEANTYVTPRGWRQCRTCNRAHYRAYYHRHYRATGPRRVAPPQPPEPPPPPPPPDARHGRPGLPWPHPPLAGCTNGKVALARYSVRWCGAPGPPMTPWPAPKRASRRGASG
jgi:hypothetical protein